MNDLAVMNGLEPCNEITPRASSEQSFWFELMKRTTSMTGEGTLSIYISTGLATAVKATKPPYATTSVALVADRASVFSRCLSRLLGDADHTADIPFVKY